MSNFHDPVRQLKYLRQTLSQNKKPLGFFLAAGCPLAVTMPEGEYPLIPDIVGLTRFVTDELQSKNDKKKNNYDVLLTELKKTGNAIPNIEDILSFVRGLKLVSAGAKDVRGLTEADLIKLEKDICEKIVRKTHVSLPNRDTPYHQLAQWIHLLDRGAFPIECFTTNYDLLLEQAFEETGVAYFDGFVGARQPFFDLRAIEDSLIPKHWTRLWKVHGSINWYLNSKREIYRATEIRPGVSCIIDPSHLKYDQSRKMPYLALIDRLNAFLRQTGSVLITSGYSFGDVHLNDTITNALKANPTAMVIALLHGPHSTKDKNGEVVSHHKKAFSCAKDRFNLSAWAFDEAVVGGNQGKWKISNPETLAEENLANIIVQIREVKKGEVGEGKEEIVVHDQLQLGDFANLGKFLQALIGKEQFKIDDAK